MYVHTVNFSLFIILSQSTQFIPQIFLHVDISGES